MLDPIKAFQNEHGVWYSGTRDQLVNAGLATANMFPENGETWRGNGLFRGPDELLWAVQQGRGANYVVMWGLCIEEEESE